MSAITLELRLRIRLRHVLHSDAAIHIFLGSGGLPLDAVIDRLCRHNIRAGGSLEAALLPNRSNMLNRDAATMGTELRAD